MSDDKSAFGELWWSGGSGNRVLSGASPRSLFLKNGWSDCGASKLAP